MQLFVKLIFAMGADIGETSRVGGLEKVERTMNLVFSLLAGFLLTILYRLFRHGTIIPSAAHERAKIAWLKTFTIIFIVAVGLWIVLTLIQNFPD